MENILTRSGKSCDRSAVEGIYKSNNFLSAAAVFVKAVFSCDLDSTLVSFCA